MVWKDAESIFQRRFYGRRRCRIVLKVPISGHVQNCVKQKCLRSFTSNKTKKQNELRKTVRLTGFQIIIAIRVNLPQVCPSASFTRTGGYLG